MMELSNRIVELLEEYDFSLCGEIIERYNDKGNYDVELETYSPEGENVIVSLTYDGTEESFICAFVDYTNDFDAEEHAEMWIESRGKNGVPNSIKDLLEDAEWIKNTLMKIAEELNNLDEESEGSVEIKGMDFTQNELQLLYAACMSYGDKLSEIIKSIPNEVETTDGLSDRAKESWNLARKITEYMEGK